MCIFPIEVSGSRITTPTVSVREGHTMLRKAILDGEMDAYPEAAFFNVGTIEDVVAKAKALEKQEA